MARGVRFVVRIAPLVLALLDVALQVYQEIARWTPLMGHSGVVTGMEEEHGMEESASAVIDAEKQVLIMELCKSLAGILCRNWASLGLVIVLLAQLMVPHFLASRLRRARMLNCALTCYLFSVVTGKLWNLVSGFIPEDNKVIEKVKNIVPFELDIINIMKVITLVSGVLSYLLFNVRNKPASLRTVCLLMPVFSAICCNSLKILLGELPTNIPEFITKYSNVAYKFLVTLFALMNGDGYLALTLFSRNYLDESAVMGYVIIFCSFFRLAQDMIAYRHAKNVLASGINEFAEDDYYSEDGDNMNQEHGADDTMNLSN